MIGRRKSSLVLFLCLQAMAVAIICLGSLINFHQYKIWGKPLIPNFVGYKRDIEKYSKTLSFSKLSRDHQHLQKDFNGNDCDFFSGSLNLISGTGSFVTYSYSQIVPRSNSDFSSGLRGPPVF